MTKATSVPSPDLERYFERLALEPERGPTPELLERLHAAHLTAIPFENLDVRLERRIALDLPALTSKLLLRRRGGYCFEHNTLFAAVLRALGYAVELQEARVRPPGSPGVLPRTHLVLRVRLPGGDRLADVGFGGDGPLLPVPFDGTPVEAAGDVHALAREPDGAWVLRRRTPEGWSDLYAFLSTPVHPIDLEVANHFTSTHPDSIFRKTLTLQRSSSEGRHYLRGHTYLRRRGEVLESREVDAAEGFGLLRSIFGIEVTREEFERALGSAPPTGSPPAGRPEERRDS